MRQPKSTHEKYIAPLVAKQIYTTHKVYAKWSICIFTEVKIHILVSQKIYSDLFGNYYYTKLQYKLQYPFHQQIITYYDKISKS